MDFLDRLVDKKNFSLHKKDNGTLLLVPKWTECTPYEFELRKEAYRLCREEDSGIKDALWTTIKNTEHRMIQWLQLISIANSRPSGGDYATLERKVNDLQREVRGRSRSPRRKGGGNRKPKSLLAQSQNLALADAPHQKRISDGKGTKNTSPKKGKSKGTQQGGCSGSSNARHFNELMRAGTQIRKKFYANDNTICYQYQRNVCEKEKCERRHICIGRGKNNPYDECRCLNEYLK